MIADRTGKVNCSVDGVQMGEAQVGRRVTVDLPTGALRGVITAFNHIYVWVLVDGDPFARPAAADDVHFERPTAMELKCGGGY